jgi:hypothetical protein
VAFSGFNLKDSYVSIINLFYEKDLKRCTAVVAIYEDKSKTKIIATTSVVVDGTNYAPSVESLTKLRSMPPEQDSNLYYIVGDTPQDQWLGFDKRIARKNIFGGWDSWVLTNNSWLLYVEDEEKYAKFEDDKWIYQYDVLDGRAWSKYMAPEVSMAEGTNPIKQMYKLMKTLPLFSECEDC